MNLLVVLEEFTTWQFAFEINRPLLHAYFEFYKQENHDLFTVKSLYFIFYSEKCCDKENGLKTSPSDLIMCACT